MVNKVQTAEEVLHLMVWRSGAARDSEWIWIRVTKDVYFVIALSQTAHDLSWFISLYESAIYSIESISLLVDTNHKR